MHSRRSFTIKLLAAILCAAAAAQSATAAGPELIRSIEGISEYRLDNGMQVLLFPDPSAPRVTVNLTLFVGSRHEGYGEAGMAHLLEHMLFKGTPDHTNIPKALRDRGAQFNGTTWLDRTNYFETLPAEGDNLDFALRLEADRMMNSYIKGEDLESEMTVVRNEFEQGENSPSMILRQRMWAVAYEWHNYGKSTIGNRADIERVPVENLRRFYRKHYQPDNAMLIVAGQFEQEQALKSIQTYFGSIPRPERELDQTYTEEPAQDGERSVTLRRVGDVAVVGAMYHTPSGGHEDYAVLDVLESILTAAPSGKLYKALVESKKAASVRGAAYALHDPGVIAFLAEVSQGNDPQVVLGSMLDVIAEFREQDVTDEQVERARQRLLKQRELTAADSKEIAIELSEWAAQGDWRLYFLYRDRVEKVTVADVQRVAQLYLQGNNRTVGMFIPTDEPQRVKVPANPDLAAIIGDYEGREAIATGEQFDVSPGNIERRTRRLRLAEGINAALLPKKTRGESVNLRLKLRYGNAENLRGYAKAAEFLPILMARGTKSLNRQQLQDELDKNRSQLSAAGTAGEATFSLQTQRKFLPQALELLRQVLREPTLPEDQLELLKQAQRSGYEKQLTDPQALAVNAIRRRITPYPQGDARYQPTIEEAIEQLDGLELSQLRNLYDSFLGAQAGELVIVGDFDSDETVPVLAKIFSRWTAPEAYEHLSRTGDVRERGTSRSIDTPDKANAMYFAAMALPMNDEHPDFPALVIGDFILGGGSLSSRLGDRVRQQDGLSYGVGSQFNALAHDPRATFYMYAIYNPANVDKLKAAITEELQRWLKDGVSQDELQTAVTGFLQAQQVARTDDGNLARVLEETVYARRTMQYYTDLEAKIQSLTTDDIHDAVRKHIDPNKLFIVTAGDFRKAESQ